MDSRIPRVVFLLVHALLPLLCLAASPRIVGGNTIELTEFPQMAVILEASASDSGNGGVTG